jgi:hypothetical protein
MAEVEHEDASCHCLLCQNPNTEELWDARDRRIAQSVREHGWHVMGGGGHTAWAYSIGLWNSLRSPEVCLFGGSLDTSVRVVNIIAGQIRDGHGYPVAIRPVHRS